uniref:Uncharacterized protein n=1 Tax=Myotis myotis TaxID=51298 RepID=A0A7J7Z4B3_MYOMY|nr:hypothetical protein mMyoMyo1_010502 [Myotis myotis]
MASPGSAAAAGEVAGADKGCEGSPASSSASGSSGWTLGVTTGASPNPWAGAGVVRGEKVTHMPGFPCAPQTQHTARAQVPPQDVHPAQPKVQQVGGLRPVFAPGQALGCSLCVWQQSLPISSRGPPHPFHPTIPPSHPPGRPPVAPGLVSCCDDHSPSTAGPG